MWIDWANGRLGSRCKAEFCWQCLAPYEKRHHRRVVHRVGCNYYEPDLEGRDDYFDPFA